MAQKSSELFAKCFGRNPRWVVAAPGRVNLIGEHTDYNDGFVLPIAIECHTVMAGDRAPSRNATVHSMTTGNTAKFAVNARLKPGEPAWSNYIRGVVAGFLQSKHKVPGFEALIESTLPYGGGLASSAALEVATATLLECASDKTLDPVQKALLCQKAEHEFAGVPCGIMDQFTAVLAKSGEALLLDCRTRQAKAVPFHSNEVTVLVVNTQVRHRLAESEYPVRRSQCESAARTLGIPALRDATLALLRKHEHEMDPEIVRRARHVITENERVLEFAEAMKTGDWKRLGELMYESHESLRTDFEVSCHELDVVVNIARKLGTEGGVFGSRMTGGGFGGCAIALVRTEEIKLLTRKIGEAYEEQTGCQASIFATHPTGGARVIS